MLTVFNSGSKNLYQAFWKSLSPDYVFIPVFAGYEQYMKADGNEKYCVNPLTNG